MFRSPNADHPDAARGAKEAGMFVVGCFDAHTRARWDELRTVCDVCIGSFEELQLEGDMMLRPRATDPLPRHNEGSS